MESAESERASRNRAPVNPTEARLKLRSPTARDGLAVHALIASCPPLDANSAYCNLLQCTHFAEFCVVATADGEIAGWVSSYLPPDQPDTLFVWQVAVASTARGRGLGQRMLIELLERDVCHAVRWIKTTITAGNRASWALFTALATRLGARVEDAPWLIEGSHLPVGHATEHLVTIGPLALSRP